MPTSTVLLQTGLPCVQCAQCRTGTDAASDLLHARQEPLAVRSLACCLVPRSLDSLLPSRTPTSTACSQGREPPETSSCPRLLTALRHDAEHHPRRHRPRGSAGQVEQVLGGASAALASTAAAAAAASATSSAAADAIVRAVHEDAVLSYVGVHTAPCTRRYQNFQ